MNRNLSVPSPHGDLQRRVDRIGAMIGTLKSRPVVGITAAPSVRVSSSPDLLEWYGSETLSY